VILDVLETITLSESKYDNVSYDFTDSTTSEMVSKGLADRVNLFFISDYTDASYLGNSAGIPGSQGLAGSHNGVLISLKAHKNGDGSLKDQLLGETAGHEMGHFLGLFHPSESNGILFDPITDTPQCPSSKNTNNDSNLTAEECGQEYGADNLMFWDAWDNGNQDNLTAGQVYVLKRALIAK
ncbi:MAG: M43 family zinc metalloprotease, partial [SAR324 cluster bacterium]|nr:M43 family zinc metalloprotease [SAR324 cluster bacterium]